MAENTRSFSLLASAVVALVCIGAGLGIGIGIGAGIWKDSSSSEDVPAAEWFFSQQADKVRLAKASPDSDVLFVNLDGLTDTVTAMTSQPNIVIATISQKDLVSALNSDPGKNAILVCDKGENKIAVPLSLGFGHATGDQVSYLAQQVPFNNATWGRVDEGRVLNASSLISSFQDGEILEFDSSCYMFIDSIFDNNYVRGGVDVLFPLVGVVDGVKEGIKFFTAKNQAEKDQVVDRVKEKATGAAVTTAATVGLELAGGAAAALGGAAVGGLTTGEAIIGTEALGADALATVDNPLWQAAMA